MGINTRHHYSKWAWAFLFGVLTIYIYIYIEVELDAKIIVDLLQAKSVSNKPFSPLLNDCRSLLSSFHQIRVRHVFRDANFTSIKFKS